MQTQLPTELTFLTGWQRDLVENAYQLYHREKNAPPGAEPLTDYAFIIFPMAKAYEGFLKQFLRDLNLIDEETFQSRKFRIGRALNPDLSEHQQNEFWLFDDVVRSCGQGTARQLWDTWLKCRNHTFHYFPDRERPISLVQAGEYLDIMRDTIHAAWSCKLGTHEQGKRL